VSIVIPPAGSEPPLALELPLGKSEFDHDVASLDLSEVVEPLAERTFDGGVRGRTSSIEKANPPHLPRLLRPSGARRDEEAACQGADERSPVHHSMT
jgi:hypothetical protein